MVFQQFVENIITCPQKSKQRKLLIPPYDIYSFNRDKLNSIEEKISIINELKTSKIPKQQNEGKPSKEDKQQEEDRPEIRSYEDFWHCDYKGKPKQVNQGVKTGKKKGSKRNDTNPEDEEIECFCITKIPKAENENDPENQIETEKTKKNFLKKERLKK